MSARERPSNNEMKLTRSTTARQPWPSQLISVFYGCPPSRAWKVPSMEEEARAGALKRAWAKGHAAPALLSRACASTAVSVVEAALYQMPPRSVARSSIPVRSRRVMPLARVHEGSSAKARQPCFGRSALSFQQPRCHLSQRVAEECGTVEQHAEADKPRVARWARLAA